MLKCEDCGRTEEVVVVSVGFCPYMEDVGGEQVQATLCEDCYGERAADI